MQISGILKAIVSTLEDRPAREIPNLRVGDVLSGKVVRLESDGRLLIDLGNFRALAHADFSVRPGETLHLKVVSTGVPLYLKTIGPEHQEASRSLPRFALDEVLDPKIRQRFMEISDRLTGRQGHRDSAGLPPRVVQALSEVQSRMEPLSLNRPTDQIVQQLKSSIEDGGLFLEKKLAEAILADAITPKQETRATTDAEQKPVPRESLPAQVPDMLSRDLKAQLLVLKDFLASGSAAREEHALTAKEAEFLRTTVDRLLMHVEEQQGRVTQRNGEGQPFQVVTHWLTLQAQPRPVRLKLYYPKVRSTRDEQNQKIALLLDMDRIGAVRVDLAMLADHLRIDFYVRDDDLRQEIEGQASIIRDALAGLFDQVHVYAHVSPEKIAAFDQEDQRAGGTGVIDVRI
jgi:hypothetical protein